MATRSRVILIAVIAVLALLETPAGSLLFGFECEGSCPDEIVDGRCPPACASCACVPQGRTSALVMPVVVDATASVTAIDAPEVGIPSDLRAVEISHVPRLPSA